LKKEKRNYLLDTHALIFWAQKKTISPDFIKFLDKLGKEGNLLMSSASIWEIALLKKKGRIDIENLHQWKNDLLTYSPVKMIEPSVSDMIDSTLLPDHHKDPFDRLFIAQAINNDALLVTREKMISMYTVETFWQ
jgi:PIN domain nuclease of toxin-antitoxin system